MFGTETTANISKAIATGGFKPNIRLTNMSTAYFQADDDFVATKLFPRVPVQLATSFYYKFGKAELARDNMQRKPEFGKVTPMPLGLTDDNYNCKVDQLIIGIDQISSLNYRRTNAPGAADPRTAKVKAAAEQAKLHLDIIFADKFFKSGVWENQKTGASATPSGANQFWQFDNDNSDPVRVFDDISLEIKKNGRRRPNKLGLGAETFRALKNNKSILERVKYSGSTANPATVNENVLAQLLVSSRLSFWSLRTIRQRWVRLQTWILSAIRREHCFFMHRTLQPSMSRLQDTPSCGICWVTDLRCLQHSGKASPEHTVSSSSASAHRI